MKKILIILIIIGLIFTLSFTAASHTVQEDSVQTDFSTSQTNDHTNQDNINNHTNQDSLTDHSNQDGIDPDMQPK